MNIGDEGAKAIGEALKVNTSLINLVIHLAKEYLDALKVNTSCVFNAFLVKFQGFLVFALIL